MKNGNMYPDVETWNPLAGECPHKCVYCSTKAWMRFPVMRAKYSGPLRLDPIAMKKVLGYGHFWFVCGQNDLFAEDVPTKFITDILAYCNKFYMNNYLFQSKNPARMIGFKPFFPKNAVLCTTIESNRNYNVSKTPDAEDRAYAMKHLHSFFATFITIEPVLDFDLDEFVRIIKFAGPDKINLGADSKKHNLPEPSKEKLLALIDELQKFTTIDRKTNLARLLK